jgi:hypothetical protein
MEHVLKIVYTKSGSHCSTLTTVRLASTMYRMSCLSLAAQPASVVVAISAPLNCHNAVHQANSQSGQLVALHRQISPFTPHITLAMTWQPLGMRIQWLQALCTNHGGTITCATHFAGTMPHSMTCCSLNGPMALAAHTINTSCTTLCVPGCTMHKHIRSCT